MRGEEIAGRGVNPDPAGEDRGDLTAAAGAAPAPGLNSGGGFDYSTVTRSRIPGEQSSRAHPQADTTPTSRTAAT